VEKDIPFPKRNSKVIHIFLWMSCGTMWKNLRGFFACGKSVEFLHTPCWPSSPCGAKDPAIFPHFFRLLTTVTKYILSFSLAGEKTAIFLSFWDGHRAEQIAENFHKFAGKLANKEKRKKILRKIPLFFRFFPTILAVLIQFIHLKQQRKGVSPMLQLDFRSARPIYEQVRDNLRRLIVSGAIQEGEKLPSVRAMASSLAINPNTIQRAYESLEAEGYVYSVPGKGSFAAPRSGVEEGRRKELLQQFDKTVTELLFLGETRQSLTQRVQAVEGREKP
jgi:GntR family transcriptional regulator